MNVFASVCIYLCPDDYVCAKSFTVILITTVSVVVIVTTRVTATLNVNVAVAVTAFSSFFVTISLSFTKLVELPIISALSAGSLTAFDYKNGFTSTSIQLSINHTSVNNRESAYLGASMSTLKYDGGKRPS